MEIEVYLSLPLNASVQAGDIAYYIAVASQTLGGFTVSANNQQVVTIGMITQIEFIDTNEDGVNDMAKITCNALSEENQPGVGDFVLFSKDAKANEGTVLGYYGEFVFHNNSKSEAEMFMSACDVSQSS